MTPPAFRALGGAAALAASVPAAAQLVPRVTDPIAVRGGVLLVPLEGGAPASGWPPGATLLLEDGRAIEGVIAWITVAGPKSAPAWTDDPRGLTVRPIQPGDDPLSPPGGAAHVLARLPSDGGGTLTLDGTVMRPRWHDLPPGAGPAASGPRPADAYDLPDASSPFEHWRWLLLQGPGASDPPDLEEYGPVGRLVAEHYAGLWRVGLSRLDAASAGAASACRDLLTAVCLDGRRPFAAWVIDPARIAALLSILLDFDRSGADLEAAARAWAAEQGLLIVRLGTGAPDRVALGVANPGAEPVLVRFRWPAASLGEAPAVAEPRALTGVDVPRPPLVEAPPGPSESGDVEVLLVEGGGWQQRLAFRSGIQTARPPGLFFAPLRPALTLADVEAGIQRPFEPQRSTLIHVRKLQGRWEVFAECRRPVRASGRALEDSDDIEGLRGVEAVTLLLGPDPPVVLAVPETGRFRFFRGAAPETLEVHRRSYEDRWCCRVVLPQSWIEASGGVLMLGAWRTHGDCADRETGPYAVLPWRSDAGRAVIDLRAWDE